MTKVFQCSWKAIVWVLVCAACMCFAVATMPAVAFAEDSSDTTSLLSANYSFVTSDGEELSYIVEPSDNESMKTLAGAVGKSVVADAIVTAPRGTESIWMHVSTYFNEYVPTEYGEEGDTENQITTVYAANGAVALKNAIFNNDVSSLLATYYSDHAKEWTSSDRYTSYPNPVDYSQQKIAVQFQAVEEEDSGTIGAGLLADRSLSKNVDLICVYLTYAEDKDAADKIAALPDAADVTLADAEAIEAARAAYDLLAQWEGAQDAIDATKLTEAEAALNELVLAANKEAADAVVSKIKAIGDVTTDSKDAIAAARAAYDALSEAQKALVPAESVATLTTAEAAYVSALETAIAEAKMTADADADTIEGLEKDLAEAKTALASSLKASSFKATAKTVTAKAKKKTSIKTAKAFTVSDVAGKVTYAKLSGSAKITVNAKGKVTVKKGLKKGKTYKVKVLVVDSGSSTVAAAAQTVTLKVKIK